MKKFEYGGIGQRSPINRKRAKDAMHDVNLVWSARAWMRDRYESRVYGVHYEAIADTIEEVGLAIFIEVIRERGRRQDVVQRICNTARAIDRGMTFKEYQAVNYDVSRWLYGNGGIVPVRLRKKTTKGGSRGKSK